MSEVFRDLTQWFGPKSDDWPRKLFLTLSSNESVRSYWKKIRYRWRLAYFLTICFGVLLLYLGFTIYSTAYPTEIDIQFKVGITGFFLVVCAVVLWVGNFPTMSAIRKIEKNRVSWDHEFHKTDVPIEAQFADGLSRNKANICRDGDYHGSYLYSSKSGTSKAVASTQTYLRWYMTSYKGQVFCMGLVSKGDGSFSTEWFVGEILDIRWTYLLNHTDKLEITFSTEYQKPQRVILCMPADVFKQEITALQEEFKKDKSKTKQVA